MPQVCTICSHPERDAIEDAVLAGNAKTRIAANYGLKEQNLRRHMKEHFPELLAMARDAATAARADSLLDRVEHLHSRTLAVLDEAEETDDWRARLAAIREARNNLELIGEVTKELNRSPTLELHVNPQWIELRALIVHALEPHPAAKEDVMRAIRSAQESGNGH